MKYSYLGHQLKVGWILAIVTATPVIAETVANFAPLNLTPGFDASQGKVEGYTGGSYSLSAISNRDKDKNVCVGFADPKPDHIMVLNKDFPHLKILVNSGGSDTTLLIQGLDNTIIHCADSNIVSKDASLEYKNWKQGTYKIWVGTFYPGIKHNYTLTVQE